MKIQEKKIIFTPVSITLETPKELYDLMEALKDIDSGTVQPLKDWYDKEYGWGSGWNSSWSDEEEPPKPVSQKEEKYVVFKLEDVKFLSKTSANFRHAMEEVIRYYYSYRETHGKLTRNKYIVCNQDEPYAEKVWNIILAGEDTKAKSNK